MIDAVAHSLDDAFSLPNEAGHSVRILDALGERTGTVLLSFRGHW